MKNDSYFTLKGLFFLNISKILSWLFGHLEKCLDQKDKAKFKTYNVTNLLKNNNNTHIDQYLKKERQSANEIWSVNKI